MTYIVRNTSISTEMVPVDACKSQVARESRWPEFGQPLQLRTDVRQPVVRNRRVLVMIQRIVHGVDLGLQDSKDVLRFLWLRRARICERVVSGDEPHRLLPRIVAVADRLGGSIEIAREAVDLPVGDGETTIESELVVDCGDLLTVGEGEVDGIPDVAVFCIVRTCSR